MVRFRSAAAFMAALVLLFSGACAEDGVSYSMEMEDISIEELIPGIASDDDVTFAGAAEDPAEDGVFTPSWGSPWDHDLGSSYWTTPMDITDTEAVWNMLMEPITVVDIGKVDGLNRSQLTKQNLYMYG